MSSELELDRVDTDGAIGEAAAEMDEALAAEGDTRLDFMKKAGLAGTAAIGGGALLTALVPGSATAAKGDLDRPPKRFGRGDIGILNYALTLEYLEAGFYNEAAKRGSFSDPAVNDFLTAVVRDENAHVKLLKSTLGRKAVKKPKFDFGDTTADEGLFVATSYALENTGVGAYAGQAFNIKDPGILAAALSIVTVEARHSGLVGQIFRGSDGIAPDGPFDKAVGAKKTLRAVKGTGFIVG